MHRDLFKLHRNMAVVLLLSYGIILKISFLFNYKWLVFHIKTRSDYAYNCKFACLKKNKHLKQVGALIYIVFLLDFCHFPYICKRPCPA